MQNDKPMTKVVKYKDYTIEVVEFLPKSKRFKFRITDGILKGVEYTIPADQLEALESFTDHGLAMESLDVVVENHRLIIPIIQHIARFDALERLKDYMTKMKITEE